MDLNGELEFVYAMMSLLKKSRNEAHELTASVIKQHESRTILNHKNPTVNRYSRISSQFMWRDLYFRPKFYIE